MNTQDQDLEVLSGALERLGEIAVTIRDEADLHNQHVSSEG